MLINNEQKQREFLIKTQFRHQGIFNRQPVFDFFFFTESICFVEVMGEKKN